MSLSDNQHAEPRVELLYVDCAVRVEIKPGIDPFSRVTGPGGDAFRTATYGYLTDRDAVLKHWAYNTVANGVEVGWGDLERGDVTMAVIDVEATP